MAEITASLIHIEEPKYRTDAGSMGSVKVGRFLIVTQMKPCLVHACSKYEKSDREVNYDQSKNIRRGWFPLLVHRLSDW